jgi:transcriptional regulator with XRE-family HTH domain
MEIEEAAHSASVPRRPKQIAVSHQAIGERIKRLRQDRGLTQVELARQLQITQSNLSAIERAARGVTVNQVVRIAKALAASTDEILLDHKAPDSGQRPGKKLMRRLRRVEELTPADQRILLQLLDGLLIHREAKRRRQAARTPAKNHRVA